MNACPTCGSSKNRPMKRPDVEGVPFAGQAGGPAADVGLTLDHGHVHVLPEKVNGGREAAEARPDHHHPAAWSGHQSNALGGWRPLGPPPAPPAPPLPTR